MWIIIVIEYYKYLNFSKILIDDLIQNGFDYLTKEDENDENDEKTLRL